MLKIIVTGEYEQNRLYFHCLAVCEDKRYRLCGSYVGSELETQAYALAMALSCAIKFKKDTIVYSNFSDVISYAKGTWKKPQLQRIKDFIKYVNKVKKQANIAFSDDIPKELEETLGYIKKAYGNYPTLDYGSEKRKLKWRVLPNFRTTLYDRNGNMLCDLTQEDYCEDIFCAIQFCRYYEKESVDPKSYFEGCKVVSINVPNIELPD